MERAILWGAVVGVAWLWVSALRVYPTLEPRIPTHFNLFGAPDGWGPRWFIFLLPLLAVLLLTLWTAIGLDALAPQASGWIVRRPLSPSQWSAFQLLLLVVVAAFNYINHQMVQISRGRATGLARSFLPIFLLALGGAIFWMVRSASS